MSYAIYIPPNARYLTHNRPYDACLLKPAEGNKVYTSKQLRFVTCG